MESGSRAASPPHIAHLLYRFDVGGLENGVVNLINAMPVDRYRHSIVCLTEYTDFRFRLRRGDVSIYALHKQPGKDPRAYLRLWRLLRQIKPDIIHTRNLATIDCLLPAVLAGVPCRVHGEHGRDMIDLDGTNRKYNLLRRALRPLVHRYIPLSRDLEGWLLTRIGASPGKIMRVYNGVDSNLFSPVAEGRRVLPVPGFARPERVVIGTVGRMEAVKDPLTLVRAFIRLLNSVPGARERLRLVMIGEGSLRQEALALLEAAGAAALAWLPGMRDDVPEILRCLDIFVLPSIAEGISNTILEAMACGLPVVATRVGGNPELVVEGETGVLAPPGEPDTLAAALQTYIHVPELMKRHGASGRARVQREFSMEAMVASYARVYDEVLSETGITTGAA